MPLQKAVRTLLLAWAVLGIFAPSAFAVPPTNGGVAPTISGTLVMGSTLTCDPKTWVGPPDPTITYQWRRTGAPIAGATAQTYTLVYADVTRTMSCAVTATNTDGTAGAVSASTAAVAGPPVNTSAPTIGGTPRAEATLYSNNGTWTGSPTGYSHVWKKDGVVIAGATSNTYTVQMADMGSMITLEVTATNGYGSYTETTAAVGPIDGPVPANTLTPAITGVTRVGQTLNCDPGTWTHSPSSYTYQWVRFGPVSVIAGATGGSYTLTASDQGRSIGCRVWANNAYGTSTTYTGSAGTATIAPNNTVLPAISADGDGIPRVGRVLSGTNGTWSGSPTYARQWLLDGTPIAGATGAIYTVVASDEGKQIVFRVTATSGGASTIAYSSPVTILPPTPINTVLPTISGTVQSGETLSCSQGTWTQNPTSYAYSWQRGGVTIAGETLNTLLLSSADVGQPMTCTVTASNAGGSAAATSTATAAVLPPAPANSVAPAISGSTAVGATLTCSQGTWSDATSYAYSWRRAGAPIAGATASTYQTGYADATQALTCRVTATGPGGTSFVTSAPVTIDAILAPAATTPPSFTGTAQVNQTLSGNQGVWTDASSYAYQWLRNGSPIAGATALAYTSVAADEGAQLSLRVTATGPGGSTIETTAPSAAVLPPAPAASTVPSITGTAQVGETLTATAGTWTNASSYSYQWRRAGVAIAGATTLSYSVANADVGSQLTFAVTATGSGGSTTAVSASTAAVAPPAPVATTVPSIAGTAQVGQLLTGDAGVWTDASSYAYQWLRDGAPIAGASALSYTLVEADKAAALQLRVTATGAGGSTSASSASTASVLPAAPGNTAPPTIAGTAQVGNTLTASAGTWTDADSYAYQWLRSGAIVAGATTLSYALTNADVGATMSLRITASGLGGSTSATSTATAVVIAAAPVMSSAPAITGTGQVGNLVAVSDGVWSDATSYSYQWLRDGAPIAGATASTYTLVEADKMVMISARVTANGPGGSTNQTTAGVGPIVPAPPNASAAPSISGIVRVGDLLSAQRGTWSDTTSYAYRWLRDGAPIAGQATLTYTLADADEGASISFEVTATGPGGTTLALSASTAAVMPMAPVAQSVPTIGGTAQVGQTLSGARGSWSYAASYAYQWVRDGTPVAGSTSLFYTLTNADLGSALVLQVTATGPGGSTSISSAATNAVVAAAPFNTSAPTIAGTAQVDSTLTGSAGTWTDATTYLFTWLRDGAPIAGANLNTYTLTPADHATRISLQVTAGGPSGSTTATSAQTGFVTTPVPQYQSMATLTGSAQVGQTLSCQEGVWTNALNFAYAWYADGVVIAGANASTYELTGSEETHQVSCMVTATGAGGSQNRTVGPTAAVLMAAPINTVAAALTGNARVQQTLSCDPGTWSGSPSFSYTWSRDGALVAGQTSSTYALSVADLGAIMACTLTATNAGGSVQVVLSSSAIAPEPPANTSLPSVSGLMRAGAELTCSAGSWMRASSFAFQWLRDGTPILGATGFTYLSIGADQGTQISCIVTVTNAGGLTSATSAPTPALLAAAPINNVRPTISGTPITGESLIGDAGSWGYTNALSYQWLRDGIAVVGATGQVYHLTQADEGALMAFEVTASGPGGTTIRTSVATASIMPQAPVVAQRPYISGAAKVSQRLTCFGGTWNRVQQISYQWLLGAEAIDGENANTYKVRAGDVDQRLACRVTAYVGAAHTTLDAVSATVRPFDEGQLKPSADGAPLIGYKLTCSSCTMEEALAHSYQWYRGREPITGANAKSYVIKATDKNQVLSVRVVATMAEGVLRGTSNEVGPVTELKIELGAGTARLPGGSVTPASHCTVRGTARADVLWGTDSDDVICGLGGNDKIHGLAGNDIIDGGAGADTIEAGIGRDAVFAGAGKDYIQGGPGNDALYGMADNDRILGGQGQDVVGGGRGQDRLFGDSGADYLWGDLGHDYFEGGTGADLITGGHGNDTIRAGHGSDWVVGAAGNDLLRGEGGNDLIWADEGNDVLWGGTGNDRLHGGKGNDRMGGDTGRDLIDGFNGRTIIYPSSGKDIIMPLERHIYAESARSKRCVRIPIIGREVSACA